MSDHVDQRHVEAMHRMLACTERAGQTTPVRFVTEPLVLTAEGVRRVLGRYHRAGQSADHVEIVVKESPGEPPPALLESMLVERQRLELQRAARIRAQATGWPGPYTVEVLELTTRGPQAHVFASWTEIWHPVRNTHDRLGTAVARARALVHGLPQDVRPGWYGDRWVEIGAHSQARVLDVHGVVVHVEQRVEQ